MFNQPLNSWNVSKVKDMKGMFRVANAFNQPIGNWDTSSVIDMSYMFSAATSFDTFIGGWNTSNVQNMDSMFAFAYYFNQEIGDWDTSNVVDMRWMFIQNYAFNRDLGNWNTSKVQIMQRMFYDARDFNQDLSAWNTSNVIDMSGMFALASSFNQNIGNWNVSNVSTMVEMLFNCGLSTANYDALLIGWSKLSLKYDVMLHTGNNIKYSPGEAASARNILIEVFNWSISDGGQIEEQPIDANPVNPSPLTQIQGDIYYYIIGTLLSLGIITSVVAFKRYSKKRTQKEPTQEPNFINATIKKPEIMTEPLTFQKYGSNICPFCASSIPKEDLHHLTEKNMNICQFCGKIIYFQ
jgi:surface protein